MQQAAMRVERPTIVLSEYEDSEVELTLAQAQALRRLCRERLTVQPGDVLGRWRIRASSYVGTVVTPDVRILIRPKIPLANLFYLLEASGKPVEVSREVFEYERTPDLISSFATFFAKNMDAALARGIPRGYVETEQRSAGVRGRVNLAAQRRLAGLVLPVECRFDEYTADLQLNRLLKAATVRLLRLPGVTVPTRGRLQQHVGRLEEVDDVKTIDIGTPVAFTRLIDHCRAAERLARIVLAGASILDSVGVFGAAAFLLDMNKIFEDFVGSRLKRYLAARLVVREQHPGRLDVDGDVLIRPDFVFDTPRGGHAYVADCKYKLIDDGYGRQADYYQLTAYALGLNLPEGLLIYCRHEGSGQPREVRVRHGGPRLRTWSVRLDGTQSEIEGELSSLANEIAVRAAGCGTGGDVLATASTYTALR